MFKKRYAVHVTSTTDFGENAGNNVDDLKIYVNEELIATF